MTEKINRLWTPDEEAALREMYETVPNKEIAKALDRTMFSVERKALHLGLRKPKTCKCTNGAAWAPEAVAYIVAHYSDTETSVLAKRFGRSKTAIRMVAGKRGIKKSSEFLRALNSRSASEARLRKSPEEIAEWNKNSGAGLHRCYRAESRRVLFGLPQKTKLVIRTPEGRKKDRYMRHLRNSFGYHFFLDTRWCVYYSDETRRSAKAEEYAKRVYHLRILPLSDRSRD